MNKLKKLVLFRERGYAEKDMLKASIENNKFFLSDEIADSVAKYLESGKVLFEFVSPTTDPYNELDVIPNKILSDGVYVWDGVIINWVRKYKVRLPTSFLEHVERFKENSKLIDELDVFLLIQELKAGVDDVYL